MRLVVSVPERLPGSCPIRTSEIQREACQIRIHGKGQPAGRRAGHSFRSERIEMDVYSDGKKLLPAGR